MRISSGKRKPSIRTAVAAIGLAMGGLAAGGGTASATAPVGASSWPAQVARPSPATCPAGETLIAPTGGWTDSLGVSHITYNSRPGMTDKIAPGSLTAGRVTPGLLTDLGLGRSGASKAAYQTDVERAVAMARTRTAAEFCYSPTPIAPPDQATASTARASTGTASPAASAAGANPVQYSSIWGGTGISEGQAHSAINGAQGEFVQPTAQFSGIQGDTVDGATWIGVGGNLTGTHTVAGLIQGGTAMTGGYYRAFYEAIGTSGCTAQTHFCGGYSAVNAVAPGQAISVAVYWENSTNACFTVAAGPTQIFNICTPVNIPYDHSSAEWVNENSQESPENAEYPNPTTVDFTYQSYSSDFYTTLGTSPFATPNFYVVVMGWGGKISSGTPISCNNSTIMSYPSNASSAGEFGSSKILTCNQPLKYAQT